MDASSQAARHGGESSPSAVLDRFFALSTDLLAVASLEDGTWRLVNPAFTRLLGWAEDELIGAPFLATVHPDDLARAHGAVAELAAGTSLASFEIRVRCRNGDYRWIAWNTAPSLPEGLLYCAGRDVTEHRRADDLLRASEERFRALAESIEDVFYVTDLERNALEYLSPSFERVWGRPAAGLEADLGSFVDTIHPDDRADVLAHKAAQLRGEAVAIEYRMVRPDGETRWILDRCFPVGEGARRSAGVASDVTARKRADAALREREERLEVLVAELQHRTRNLVAVIRSVAERTLAGATDLAGFGASFRARLGALARVQGLLSRLEKSGRVTFDELIRAELGAMGAVDEAGHGERVALDGPAGVRLRSIHVQTLALALHELATNAAKYGALAQPGGRLTVRWRLLDGDRPRLCVEWVESGVAMPAAQSAPGGSGYGRELIERALPYQMDATTSLAFGLDGVRCVIELPVSESEAQAPGRSAETLGGA